MLVTPKPNLEPLKTGVNIMRWFGKCIWKRSLHQNEVYHTVFLHCGMRTYPGQHKHKIWAHQRICLNLFPAYTLSVNHNCGANSILNHRKKGHTHWSKAGHNQLPAGHRSHNATWERPHRCKTLMGSHSHSYYTWGGGCLVLGYIHT